MLCASVRVYGMVPLPVLFVRRLSVIVSAVLMQVASTTYIGQVMAYELGREPDHDIATRTGAFAMLIYSLGTITPPLYTLKHPFLITPL